MNNSDIQRMYLNNFAEQYGPDVVSPQSEIYAIVNPILRRATHGATLLVGAGPTNHINGNEVSFLVALDYSESMLRGPERKDGAVPICADALALPFDRGSFNTAVLPFVIHHLGGDTVAHTDMAVRKVIEEACRVLRPGGRLLIVDLFLGAFLESVERSIYGIATHMLNAYGKPNMFFFSVGNLLDIIKDLPMRVEDVRRLEMTEPLVLTLLAPQFKISPRYHPAKFHYIQCVKKST